MSALPLTLTPEEMYDITGYTRAAEQLRWFEELGVPAKRRADGTVSVAREHYLRSGAPRDKIGGHREPNWSALAPQAKA